MVTQPSLLLALLGLAGLVLSGTTPPTNVLAQMKQMEATMEELKVERQALSQRLQALEQELLSQKEKPKVAFTASLGGNGLQKTLQGNRDLVYTEVLTNVGGAYDKQTGEFKAPVRGVYYIRFTLEAFRWCEFKAPVRGVYYIRFTANGPTDFPLSAVLYKNNQEIQLIVHEQPSGEGSDTASNGAALLLEEGDTLKLVLWQNTQIWDNSNHHSTFSGFLLFPVPKDDGEVVAVDPAVELQKLQASMGQLQADNQAMKERLEVTEKDLKARTDVPKVAFTASLGGNGLKKTTSGNVKLHYREVLTNVGGAYNSATGEFKAPVRGVYYIRFTANGPTDFPLSAVLYKNNQEIQLIVHEQPSGEGSDTASNGAALLLEEGDTLSMQLWHNTQIWDNSNHHSTFSGFLLFPV